MATTFLPASFWAVDQVVGPPPVVDIAPTISGWAWSRATATAVALGGSAPSATGNRTVSFGQYSGSFAVNTAATSFSVTLLPFWVMATEPAPSLPSALSLSHMALAASWA